MATADLTLSRKAKNFFIYFYLPLSGTEPKTKVTKSDFLDLVTIAIQLMNNLEADGLGRALANAGSALDAVALINLGSAISNSDSTDGASSNAALASDAFLFVNFSSHFFLLVNG